MPIVWNSENTSKLLLMVIQNDFTGTPNYERLAREWGSEVSVASLRIKFCKLKRDGVKKGRIAKYPKTVGTVQQQEKTPKEEEGNALKEEEEMSGYPSPM